MSDAVLDPSAGTNVDTLTWQVLSAADGATCALYLVFRSSDGSYLGNQTNRQQYHAGQANKWVVQVAPDIHDGTATYTLACWIGAETYENKHWATPGEITVE